MKFCKSVGLHLEVIMMMIDRDLKELLNESRELSWKNFGKRLVCYIPGMFTYYNERGKYPAISITSNECALSCDHCKGQLLDTMIYANSPEKIVDICKKLEAEGNEGCLLSGGCFENGTLPWNNFISSIKEIKKMTNLKISVHTGFIDFETAKSLKDAGVDQALFDVVCSDDVLKNIYHLDVGTNNIIETMDAINRADLDFVPHIIVGINYGQLDNELYALDLISKYNPKNVVIVAFMPLEETPMKDVIPPSPENIAKIIAIARIKLPSSEISLGCARSRKNKREIDNYAIDAGVNRIAIPAEEAVQRAKDYGLEIIFKNTCCSVSFENK